MKILGIGTDIVECSRIAEMIDEHGEAFLRRIYTESEILYCHSHKRSTEHFAARWAAKEAIFKCLGLGWRGPLQWTDFEISHDEMGKPQVRVGGRSRDYLQSIHIQDIQISLSHCRTHATAMAIAIVEPNRHAPHV